MASLIPGLPAGDVIGHLRKLGHDDASDQSWTIKIDAGWLVSVAFNAGFARDVPVHRLHMGEHFESLLSVYPDAGVLLTVRSRSGRNPYFIPLPQQNAELIVDLGSRNELETISVMPHGWLRRREPRHWQSMTNFMERREAKRLEDIQRAAELKEKRQG